jgi:O-antigen ligase
MLLWYVLNMLKQTGRKIQNFAGSILPPDAGGAEKFFILLNSAITILMGIYLFVNPLPLSAVAEFCYYLSLAALIILVLYKRTDFTLRSPLTLSFVLFFIWAAIGLFFTLDFNNTLHDLRGHLLEYLIIFYLLVNYFNSQKRLEIISWIVIASATVFSIGAIIQYYFIEGFPFSDRLGVQAFQAMHTDYIGFVTVFAITLALNNLTANKKAPLRMFSFLCFLILCTATLLTQSRGAIIGLFTSLVFLCFNNKKFLILVVLFFLLVLLAPDLKERFNYQDLVHNERSQINRLTLEVIKEHPLTGIGFGMQIYGNKNLVDLEKLNRKLPAEYQQKKIIISPHNTLLDIAVRTGIIGAILFLNILLTTLLMLWKILRSKYNEYFRSWAICLLACLVSFLVPALFADTTFGPQVIVFYTILAMITILWRINQKE